MADIICGECGVTLYSIEGDGIGYGICPRCNDAKRLDRPIVHEEPSGEGDVRKTGR